MYAAEILGLDLPQSDKRLVTFVETDGCFADGVAVATGCALGHRTMRLVDFGKVAATFADTQRERVIRIAPRPEIRQMARQYAPAATNKWQAQLEGYQVMPAADLFIVLSVVLEVSLQELISRPGRRVCCQECGEEIINEREVVVAGTVLCQSCAGQGYYHVGGYLAALPVETGIELPIAVGMD
jgi:formylmethanofuran dehydrogenase subunit E